MDTQQILTWGVQWIFSDPVNILGSIVALAIGLTISFWATRAVWVALFRGPLVKRTRARKKLLKTLSGRDGLDRLQIRDLWEDLLVAAVVEKTTAVSVPKGKDADGRAIKLPRSFYLIKLPRELQRGGLLLLKELSRTEPGWVLDKSNNGIYSSVSHYRIDAR